MAHQWNELCNALRMANKDELISFFEVLSIEGNLQKLTELEQSLVESLSQTFATLELQENCLAGFLSV